MDTVSLYIKLVLASFRSQMQHKASFIMMSIGNLLASTVDFMGIWILFDRFGALEGWTLYEVAVFYGMINVAFAVAEACGRGFDMFSLRIRSGSFDRMLLRPRGASFQVLADEFQLTRIGRFTQGLAVLIIGISNLGYAWSAHQYAVMMMCMAAGVAVFFALLMMQAACCFWTIDPPEIFNVLTYGGITALSYPLSIFAGWIRAFFTFVIPLAVINYLPAAILFGKDTGIAPGWAYIAPLVGGVFVVLGMMAMRIGVRHYASTGS